MAEKHSSYLFTSESVTEGHPDKICDQISDAILDAILAKEIALAEEGYIAPDGNPADPAKMRCACETLVTTGTVFVTGEIRTQAYVDVQSIARDVVCSIGYDRAKYGFDGNTCAVMSSDPRAVLRHRPGRGRVLRGPARRDGRGRPLRDDWRGRPGHDVRLCLQRDEHAHAHAHLPGPSPLRAPDRGAQERHAGVSAPRRQDPGVRALHRRRRPRARREGGRVHPAFRATSSRTRCARPSSRRSSRPVFEAEGVALANDCEIYVNPTGRFVIGGPMGDAGLTGRKIIVDTYGGMRTPRRRGILRQGLHQGGSLGGLRGALGRQKRRGRGTGRPAARCRSPMPSAWRSR